MTDAQVKRITNTIIMCSVVGVMTLWFLMTMVSINIVRELRAIRNNTAAAQTLTIEPELQTLAPDALALRYHTVDNGIKTFSPLSNQVCYWINLTYNDQPNIIRSESAPLITNRANGLSCLYLSDEDYESYLDRYPR